MIFQNNFRNPHKLNIRIINLKQFCETAAGLSVGDPTKYWWSYWIKDEDMKKPISGLPILPEKYTHLIRQPIETKITRVVKGKVIPSKDSTELANYDEILYTITLDAGKNKKIKEGMNFFAEDLGEWIQIEKVLSKSSRGFIRRGLDTNNQEECWDSEGGSGSLIPCKTVFIGMKVRTKISDYF